MGPEALPMQAFTKTNPLAAAARRDEMFQMALSPVRIALRLPWARKQGLLGFSIRFSGTLPG
jgi:hypothetical protein